jgi:hypothetical protein
MTLPPKQEGTTFKAEEFRSRRSDVHTGPKIAHTGENQKTPNATNRPQGSAPHELKTLLPKQEGTTLKMRELQSRRFDINTGPETVHPRGR